MVVHPSSPCPAPIPPAFIKGLSPLPSDFIPDAVSPKMLEELKTQLDSLAQEVALLKEQQALQTGEWTWLPLQAGVRWTQGLRPAARGPLLASGPTSGNWLAPRVQGTRFKEAPPQPASSQEDPLMCGSRKVPRGQRTLPQESITARWKREPWRAGGAEAILMSPQETPHSAGPQSCRA